MWHLPIYRIQAEVPYPELLFWARRFQERGGPESWKQTALLAAIFRNQWGGKAKPDDFLPYKPVRRSQQTPHILKATAIAAFGSRIKKNSAN